MADMALLAAIVTTFIYAYGGIIIGSLLLLAIGYFVAERGSPRFQTLKRFCIGSMIGSTLFIVVWIAIITFMGGA